MLNHSGSLEVVMVAIKVWSALKPTKFHRIRDLKPKKENTQKKILASQALGPSQ